MKFRFGIFFTLFMFLGLSSVLCGGGREEPFLVTWPTPDSVAQYRADHPQVFSSGIEKINYLIDRVKMSQCLFFRNGAEYDAKEGAKFLRWKWLRPKWRKIRTAEEFVKMITNGSTMSGQPYYAIYPDGNRVEFMGIMERELNFLNSQQNASAQIPEKTAQPQPAAVSAGTGEQGND